MNEENILFQLENLQTLLKEANNVIEEIKDYFNNEINGVEYLG